MGELSSSEVRAITSIAVGQNHVIPDLLALSHYTARFALEPLVGESSSSEVRAITSIAVSQNHVIPDLLALSHYTARSH